MKHQIETESVDRILLKETRHKLWNLSWPAMISGLSVPILGLIDTAIVGRYGVPTALGAVALGSWLFDLIYWSFGFIRMGTTGLVSQARGRGEFDTLRPLLARPLIIGIGLGVLVVLLSYIVSPIALSFIAGTDGSVERKSLIEISLAYFRSRLLGGPAVLANYALIGWLLGMGEAKRALIMQLGLNLSNAFLSMWWGGYYGVEGIGFASAVSQWLTALYWGRRVWFHECPPLPWLALKKELLDRASWLRLLTLHLNLWLRTCLLLSCFGLINAVSSRLGTLILSANALLLHLQSLQAFALDGFAHGAEVIVGECLGAEDKRGYVRALRVGIEWTMLTAFGISLLYFLCGESLLRQLTHHQNVVKETLNYLNWAILSPIISAPCFLLDGVMIGAVRTRAMRNSMILSTLALLISLIICVPQLANDGLWLSFLFFMSVRCCTLLPTAFKLAK